MQTIQTEIGITPTGRQATATRYTVQCGRGHRRVIHVSADRARWEWADGTHGTLVPKESYAYTHGGCCYRAACARVGADGSRPEPAKETGCSNRGKEG